ncbi:glycoside hydrolase family 2 protein [Paenibacillus polysaccharolyticus]|uniref:glycoside hydrolase family 2 protein n=1 Tax=Paenibacillus polysaccharolyticus TaxID=582692 RepID=UPI00280BDCF5|nr:sugar-binding domain-containing protein [Paenibacillus polysaccharolyticus]
MTNISYYRSEKGKRYLDEVQDEAYSRSSLHGDAWVDADSRIPIVPLTHEMKPVMDQQESELFYSAAAPTSDSLLLSGVWRMKGGEAADPGSPAPATGWFGRKALPSEGMRECWYDPEHPRKDWLEMRVPATVQQALLDLGLMDDPHWNTNSIDELEQYGSPQDIPVWFRRTRVECTEWWFATTFEVPQEWDGRRLSLEFDGIDYSGTVFLNGVSLGHHQGMFGGPLHDVTHLVRWNEANVLVVRIDPAPQSWNGLMKPSPGFGWHYGHLISLGIWKDVRLTSEPDLALLDPYVITKSVTPGEALLQIEFTVDSTLVEQVSITIEGLIRLKTEKACRESSSKNDPVDSTKQDSVRCEQSRFTAVITVPYGKSKFCTDVRLNNPQIWWPSGYGDQPLYELVLRAVSTEHTDPEANDMAHELISTLNSAWTAESKSVHTGAVFTSFAIRTIEMRPLIDTRPETDYRWQFVINGEPSFIKGANWCWPDVMLTTKEGQYERLLELARRGHVQMLRAWGGGIVESDEFYTLCDEKGIMVYQELPLCWGPPDAPLTDLGVIDRQTVLSIKRLRNHPSLIMWGGGNENGPHGGADEGLFLVGKRCREYDPSRPFHRTDPWGGSTHNWNVYHGGEPLDQATLAMPSVFYGEFGIPSQTNVSSCLRYMPEEALSSFPPTEESRGWKAHFHQFSLKDIVKVMRYAAYGPIRNWHDYIIYSQTAQGDAIRFTADIQRAGTGKNKSGYWYYKFTDCFPGHSWAVVDYYGTAKLSYYRAKQACRPQNAFITTHKMDGWQQGEMFHADLHLVNDSREILTDVMVQVRLYGSQLTEMTTWEYPALTVNPGLAYCIDTLEIKLPQASCIAPFLMAVTLHARNGSLISDQWYWFNAQPKTAELLAFEREHRHDANEYQGKDAEHAFMLYGSLPNAPLRELPCTSMEASAVYTDDNSGVIIIRNIGSMPAIRIMIHDFPEDWSCFLDDNDFGLLPGEERRISFEIGSEIRLNEITVSAWNASKVTIRHQNFLQGKQTNG